MCSSLKAAEKKRWDSIRCAHVFTGGPRFTQWGAECWAGCCNYWTLVHGTRRTENRNSAEWTCGDVVFTAWWAQKLQHSLTSFRTIWKDPLNSSYSTDFPAGPGPFPAMMDLWGLVGGLVEYRSALFASRGYASLSLAYLGHKDLPGSPKSVNVGDAYFKV